MSLQLFVCKLGEKVPGFRDMWQLGLCKPFPLFYVFGYSTNKLDSPPSQTDRLQFRSGLFHKSEPGCRHLISNRVKVFMIMHSRELEGFFMIMHRAGRMTATVFYAPTSVRCDFQESNRCLEFSMRRWGGAALQMPYDFLENTNTEMFTSEFWLKLPTVFEIAKWSNIWMAYWLWGFL